jgi:hypothetical protein
MAYAFNRINDTLDKANIFEGQNTDSTAEEKPSTLPERMAPPESAPLTTSTGVGPSVQSSNPQRPKGSSMVGGNIGQRATQVALKEAQKGGIEVPGIFGRLTQSLDKQKADLQASANTYLNNQREAARKASEITDEQIGAAAEGNTEAYNRVATGATNPTPRTPDALTPTH